ncbi:phosphatidylinositol phosphate synthase [Corynebacterium aquilae]|uniref:Phosphatidylinositol phosphate synthase n=1 Tax=Corynebacterium aquilae DSM 44791 TaxID=1431546 RepID=A0A1L7CGB9_9CORY|nr:CDP-alcohol phosphatidyltransferase family protein [Corynebacterium aquilae]APT84879.1 phosphatidylglycerophosphate synthase [Corynebacterium aquilae DSM 44791]
MFSSTGRGPISIVVDPIASRLVKAGITPNQVTVTGTAIAVAAAVVLIPTGHVVAAAILMGIFAAFDLLDGTMARMRGGGTAYGATLDASCDRIADGALFGAIVWWMVYTYQPPRATIVAALVVLVSSQVISYVKARGEAGGLTMGGGLIERAERLVLGLVGIGLTGLGVPYAIDVAIWVLALGSIFTIYQRFGQAANSPGAMRPIAAPKGAKEYRA